MQYISVLLLLSIVSGDTEVTVTDYLNKDVLLPCDCKISNLTNGFKWQITTKNLFCYWNSRGGGNCSRHIVSFQNDNCSIRLTNITEEDNGTYMCVFTSEVYTRTIVHLVVNTTSPPSEEPPTSQTKDRHTFTEDRPRVYLPIIIIAAVLLLFGCTLIVLCKRRRNPPWRELNEESTPPRL